MHTGNDTVIVSFLRPNVTIAVVDDFKKYQLRQIPPQYKGFVDMDEVTLTYAPFVWYNNFWLLRDYLVSLGLRAADFASIGMVNWDRLEGGQWACVMGGAAGNDGQTLDIGAREQTNDPQIQTSHAPHHCLDDVWTTSLCHPHADSPE